MRYLWIVLMMLLVVQITSANDPAQSAAAKTLPGILPPNYECTMTVYTAADGKAHEVPAQVHGYVIWTDRPLTLEYYVSDDLNGVRYWNVMSRESLDAVCK